MPTLPAAVSRLLRPALILVVAGLVGPNLPASAQQPPAPAQATPSRQPATARRNADPAARMWWNQERMVAALGLKEEQRQAMDADLATCLETRRQQIQRYGELRREMGDKLAAGDWDGARAKSAAASSAYLAMGEAETELAISVIRHLSEAQRKQLAEQHPQIFSRRWLVGGARAMRGAGRGRGAGQGAGPGG